MNTRRWIVPASVILIAIVAVALRLYRLDAVPPGLQHDEAFHGHDAVTVLLGYHPIYFPSNAGNEPLYIYLTAGTIALFGKNVWGIRLAAVVCGLATVGFTGLWIRRAYNTRTALIASALVAVTFWPLFMSRAGLRSAALPPLAVMTAWVFWGAVRGVGTRYGVLRFVLAGVLLGATLYTYPASRVLPIVYLLFFTFYAVPKYQSPIHSTLPGIAAFFITAGLVFLPLYLYLRQCAQRRRAHPATLGNWRAVGVEKWERRAAARQRPRHAGHVFFSWRPGLALQHRRTARVRSHHRCIVLPGLDCRAVASSSTTLPVCVDLAAGGTLAQHPVRFRAVILARQCLIAGDVSLSGARRGLADRTIQVEAGADGGYDWRDRIEWRAFHSRLLCRVARST